MELFSTCYLVAGDLLLADHLKRFNKSLVNLQLACIVHCAYKIADLGYVRGCDYAVEE